MFRAVPFVRRGVGVALKTGGSSENSVRNAVLERAAVRRRRIRDLTQAFAKADGVLLSERDRALLGGILAKLHEVARASLAAALVEALDDVGGAASGSPTPRAEPAFLGIGGLIEQALYRANAHRLSAGLRTALGDPNNGAAVSALLESPVPAVTEAAKAYLVDEARRVDSYQDPILRPSDLTGDQCRALLWHVAAGLRLDWIGDAPEALDRAIEAAARDLAGTAESEARARPSLALARALAAERRDPAAMIELLREGEVALLEAHLVALSGIDPLTVRRLVFDPDLADLALLCQATGWSPDMVASVSGLLGAAAPDPAPQAEADRALDYWRRDPAYRDAVEEAAALRLAVKEE